MAAFEMRAALPPAPGTLATSGWSTHRQGGGTVAHAVIARELKEMLADGAERMNPDRVMTFLADELALRDRSPGERFAIPPVEIVQLRKTLRKFARDNEFTTSEVAGVEMRLETAVQYPEDPARIDHGQVDRTLTGQIDLLLISDDDHATVCDWKDTWMLPPTSSADAEGPGSMKTDDKLSAGGYFQQRFYALLVMRAFPSVRSVTLREFYLRRSEPREATIWRDELPRLVDEFGALAERYDRAYATAAPDEVAVSLEGAARDVLAALDGDGDDLAAIAALRALVDGERPPLHRAWEPSPGGHCSYCPEAENCPVPPEHRGAGGIDSAEEAMLVAGTYLKAKRVAELSRERLATWADRHGPIRIRDGKRRRFFGFVTSKVTTKPTADQVARAVAEGRDPRKLYRTRIRTEFRDFSPDTNGAMWDDEDLTDAFERAAAHEEQKATR